MRRIGVVLGVAAVMAAAAALTAGTALAQAQPEKYHDRYPIDSAYQGCTELVHVEGTLHIRSTVTTDPNGGYHYSVLQSFHGEGVGETSGDKYIINHPVISAGTAVAPPNSVITIAYTDSRQVIRLGSETPEEDLILTVVYHVTINANGEVTSELNEVKGECK